jgi:hypothetical protein
VTVFGAAQCANMLHATQPEDYNTSRIDGGRAPNTMSWLGDLVSGFGLPAGAATIATAMYAASRVAQKAARRGALVEIGRFLNEPLGSPSAKALEIVRGIFQFTFGEQHISFKCIRRSFFATLTFIITITITLHLENRSTFFDDNSVFGNFATWFTIVIMGIIPDYIALYKTRMILDIRWLSPLALITLDVALSLLISSTIFVIYDLIYMVMFYHIAPNMTIILDALVNNLEDLITISPSYGKFLTNILFTSTLLTYVWAGLTFLGFFALKILLPVRYFMTWFFDLEKRPIEAIGLTAGALVILSAVVLSVVRLLIWR